MHRLRQMIREIVEEELDEITASGATPGFMTPNAFQGDSAAGEAKKKKNANQAGYKIVGDV